MKKANYFVPVLTCFKEDGSLDLEAQREVYRFLIAGGIDGIVVMGSMGEFCGLSMEQKKALVDLAAEEIKGKVKLLIGTGSMRLAETVELSNYALDKGADAVMIVSPFYFKLSDAEIERYYDACAEQICGNIYIYNFPERTVHDVSPEITLRLLRKHPNIKGYKDTVPGMTHTRQLMGTVLPEFPDFVILSGFDDNFFHNVFSGGDGCIAGISNLYPEVCAGAAAAANSGDPAAIEYYQKKLNKIFELYGVGNFVPVFKKAMALRGVPMPPYCSFPFAPVTEEETEKIKAIMAEAEAM